MKKIYKLVLQSFIGPFILVFFIVLFILLLQFLWKYIDELVGKGLDFLVIAELLAYASATLVPMALPLAILMSSLMTFGNMGEHYELTAVKASGVSLQKIMLPVIVLVIFIGFGAFFFANNVLPYCNLKMYALLHDVRKQKQAFKLVEGQFYGGIKGYSIKVGKKNPKTGMMYGIQIYDHTDNQGNTNVTIADSGIISISDDNVNLLVNLYDGHNYTEESERKRNTKHRTFPHRYYKFEKQELIIELSDFGLKRTNESLFKSGDKMMPLSMLQHMIDSISREKRIKHLETKRTLTNYTLFKLDYRKRNTKKSSAKKKEEGKINDRKKRLARLTGNVPQNKDSIPEARIKDIKPHLQKYEPKDLKEETKKKKPSPGQAQYSSTDSIYANLTLDELGRVHSQAVSYARNARSFVGTSESTDEHKEKRIRRYEIEWHKKFTIAFSCLIFLFVGAPLGAIIRKGGLGLPLVISALLFIFHYIISLTGEKLVRESVLLSIQGMWLSPAIMLVAGVFLTYQATTDSTILNLETYTLFFKKLFSSKKRSIIEQIRYRNNPDGKEVVKSKLLTSLDSLHEVCGNAIIEANKNLGIIQFTMSLCGLKDNSNLIMFQTLYLNNIASLKNSNFYNAKEIKKLIGQLPFFKYGSFLKSRGVIVLRLIFIFGPMALLLKVYEEYSFLLILGMCLLLAIIIVGHLIKLVILKNKLVQIQDVVMEIIERLKSPAFVLDANDEDSNTLR